MSQILARLALPINRPSVASSAFQQFGGIPRNVNDIFTTPFSFIDQPGYDPVTGEKLPKPGTLPVIPNWPVPFIDPHTGRSNIPGWNDFPPTRPPRPRFPTGGTGEGDGGTFFDPNYFMRGALNPAEWGAFFQGTRRTK